MSMPFASTIINMDKLDPLVQNGPRVSLKINLNISLFLFINTSESISKRYGHSFQHIHNITVKNNNFLLALNICFKTP